MTDTKPYFYVRYTWLQEHKLEKLAEELGAKFTIVKPPPKKQELIEKSITGKTGKEIEVKAETLFAFLSSQTAVLFQKKKGPFTERDRELRKTLLELYPHVTLGPIPMGISSEPKFEVRIFEQKKAR